MSGKQFPSLSSFSSSHRFPNASFRHRVGKREGKEGGGYSRFPISNNIDGGGSPAADGDYDSAAAAVCAARQDSERNSRLRQKSWEPNSFRCCRTHAEDEREGAVYLQQASGQKLPSSVAYT